MIEFAAWNPSADIMPYNIGRVYCFTGIQPWLGQLKGKEMDSHSQKHILLVEDEVIIAMAETQTLQDLG